MSEVSNNPRPMRVTPMTLYADTPDGAAVFIERLYDSPRAWLSDNGMPTQSDCIPVVIMLDPGKRRIEFSDTVGLDANEEAPLKRIDEAIAALTLARAALVAAGQVDFIPKGGVDSALHTCPGCGAKVIGHETCGDPNRPECSTKDAR